MKQDVSYAEKLHEYIVVNCLWINKNVPELANIYIEKLKQQDVKDVKSNAHAVEFMVRTLLISFSRVERMVYLTKAAKDNEVTPWLEKLSELYFELTDKMLGKDVAETSMRLGREITFAMAKHGAHDEAVAQVATAFFMKEPKPYEDVIDQELLQRHFLICLDIFHKFLQTYWDSKSL